MFTLNVLWIECPINKTIDSGFWIKCLVYKGPLKNYVILLGGRGGHQKITNDHRGGGGIPEKIT